MWYYKARLYSPTLGRFMQTDPIGYADGMNWYNYVDSDPVNFTDPLGLSMLDGDDDIIVVTGWRRLLETIAGSSGGAAGSGQVFHGSIYDYLAPEEQTIVVEAEKEKPVQGPPDCGDGSGAYGIWGAASGDLGIIAAGASYQTERSMLSFANGEKAIFSTNGGYVGGPGYGFSDPGPANPRYPRGGVTGGGSFGAGGGYSYSNARTPNDLVGRATTTSINAGPYGISISKGENGIFSVDAGMSRGFGYSVSIYDTNTRIIARTGC